MRTFCYFDSFLSAKEGKTGVKKDGIGNIGNQEETVFMVIPRSDGGGIKIRNYGNIETFCS